MNSTERTELAPFVPILGGQWLTEFPDVRYRQLRGSMASADISGFTRLSEGLAERGREGAELLTNRINSCFDAIIAAASRFGGDVIKFGGDAVLVFFDGDGHGYRSLHGCIEMQRALADQKGAEAAGLTMTVGVHSGLFDFWLIGDQEYDIVVSGPAATTVVELETAGSPGQVMASIEALGAFELRQVGTSQAMAVFDLMAFHDPVVMNDRAPLDVLVPNRVASQLKAVELTEGEHRPVSMGFVSFDGVDDLIAAGRTNDVAVELDRLFAAVRRAETDYGVTFLHSDVAGNGGKLLLAAGAPVSTGNDEEAMVRAMRSIADLEIDLRLRASVNSGRVFAGFVGTQLRRTYTLMGDAVNLSARLLGQADPGDVVAGAQIVARLEGTFKTRPIEPFMVKGKSELISAVHVDALSGPAQTEGLMTAPGPLIGRVEELARLSSHLDDAVDGSGGLVEIVGEPGAGKTRLVQAGVELNDGRLDIVRHACGRYEQTAPYATARALLRSVLGIDSRLPRGEAGQRLLEIIESDVPEVRDFSPLLADMLGAEVPPTPAASAIAPEFRPARSADAVADLLVGLQRRLLIIVEDAHWMDDVSRNVVGRLAAEARGQPWLIVVARRVGEGRQLESSASSVLELQSLRGDELKELVLEAAAPLPLSDAELDSIMTRSDGNPLFATELASYAASAHGELPDSVEALIISRVDELPARPRSILRLASVLGVEFDHDLLDEYLAAQLTDYSSSDFAMLNEYLGGVGHNRLSFVHTLHRDVAYDGLPYAFRRELHRSVGDLLERRVDRGEPISAAALTGHFSLAGDRERTWRYGLEAGDRARERYANEEAADAYRRALEASSRLRSVQRRQRYDVALTLGDVLELGARYDDAEDAYRKARRLGEVDVEKAVARQRLCWVKVRSGDYRGAHRMQQRLLGELDDETSDLRELKRKVLLDRLGMLTRADPEDEFAALAESIIADARLDGDALAEARASNYLLGSLVSRHDADDEELAARASEFYEMTGDERSFGMVQCNVGVSRYFRGEWASSIAAYERSRHLLARVGDAVTAATIDNNIGEILSDQGRLDEALELFDNAERVWRAASYPIGLAVVAMNRGRALTRTSAGASAAAPLREAAEAFESFNAAPYLAECRVRQAEAATTMGLIDEARRLVDEIEAMPDTDEEALLAPVARVRAAVAMMAGREDEARQLGRLAVEKSTSPYERLHGLRTLRFLGLASSDEDQEADGIESALGIVRLPLLIVDALSAAKDQEA